MKKKILVGNIYPTSLVRRPTLMVPCSVEEFRAAVAESAGVVSFWGHTNTIAAAQAVLGVDVRPAVERPALTLDADNLPTLAGEAWDEVWVCSPNYRPGFRPAIGVEVSPEDILGWQVLRITFP